MKMMTLKNIRICSACTLLIILSLGFMAGPASAEGPGLYKDGQKIADLVDLGVPPLESLSAASSGASSQIQELRQRVLGTQEPSAFREQRAYFATVLTCRDLILQDETDVEQLISLRQRLIDANQSLLASFRDIGSDIQNRGYGADKLARHDEFMARHQEAADELIALLGDLEGANDPATRSNAIAELRRYFQDNIISHDPPALNSGPATINMEMIPAPVVSRADLPIPSTLTDPTPMPAGSDDALDDLGETIEVQFTPEITALAAELNNSPVEIFSYVHDNFSFEAYRGSRKGAQQTLDHQSGNDYDQASLLIALLRVSGIPARYVRGVVEMPIDAATAWLGFDDPAMAASYLHTTGFQVTAIGIPVIEALRFEWVWVEAYLPYINYRGSGHDGAGAQWIPLDPAFKQYTYESAIDLLSDIGFDADGFLSDYYSSLKDSTPVEMFEQLLLDSLTVYHPGSELADLIRDRWVVEFADGILPGTLPYYVVSRDAVFDDIPDLMRYKIRFHLYDGAGMDLDYPTSLPEIAGKQVTISYVGATAADQLIIDDAGGMFGVAQPWTVDLKPVLKIDGCQEAIGAGAIMMGRTHTSEMIFTSPDGAANLMPVVSNVITAGNYQGIGINTEQALPALVEVPPTACAEDYLGQVLHQTALTYLYNVNEAEDHAADLMHVVLINDVAEAIVENTLRVLFTGGLPTTFEWTGMVVDADRKIVGNFSYTGADLDLAFMKVGGADGSWQENRVFETVFNEEAVSTIKILQIANDFGVPVLDMTPAMIPLLTHPASVVSSVSAALAAGRSVLIPRDPILYFDWYGTGWIDMEPDGSAGYLISGGIAGGATVQEWQVTYPDMVCMLPIGPIEVEPSAPDDLYCWENDAKLKFIVPILQYWGLDDEDACEMLHSERKEFPVRLTIREICEAFGPGKFTFKAGQTGPCGCTILEKEITIGKLDLTIHRAPVLDPAESPIDDNIELSQGAQTLVNLDNDDKDDKYDTGVSDIAVAGENEMCKVVLKISPKEMTDGTAMLQAFGGTAAIKIWKSATKGVEYVQGTALTVASEFTVDGNSLIKELWVEGIDAHTSHPGVKLKMSTTKLPNCGDWVALTVIGIDKIEWTGKNNSNDDDNILDADPNWPAGLSPGSDRVFPGARIIGGSIEGSPRDKVDVKVTLTVEPVRPLSLYFRAFDVDDPTADTEPLDLETQVEDNRGTTPAKAGKFTGATGHTKELIFFLDWELVEFQTTMQPGDNFRVVGNGDKLFLADLANEDGMLGAVNADKQRITNKFIPGAPAAMEIREPDHYASKVLTVWRQLHLEFDSFGDVKENYAEGIITSLAPGDNLTCQVVQVDNALNDGSPDLDGESSGVGNGRFEKGILNVAGTHNIADLDGNGDNFLQKAAGINVCAVPLSFKAWDNDWFGNSTLEGTVTKIDNNSTVLHLNITAHSETPIDWPDFHGGTVKIGNGPAMSIVSADAGNSTVTVAGLKIPYKAFDDDMGEGLDVPEPDMSIIPVAFAPGYVLPVQDAGNHQGNLPFIQNVFGNDNDSMYASWQFDWKAQEALKRCWIVYLCGSFQEMRPDDGDPNSEGWVLGRVDELGPPVSRGQGACIFMEAWRTESSTNDPARGRTEAHSVAHEVGHIFGGLHSDCIPPETSPCVSAGLMAQTWLRTIPDFNAITLNKIRSIDYP